MAFVEGQEYPLAFLLFDCSETLGNYLNDARSAAQSCFSSVDPAFTEDSQVLSGDLLPGAAKSLGAMIEHNGVQVDLTRADRRVARQLSAGEWPGEVYLIGFPFEGPAHVDAVHNMMREDFPRGYRGLFTVLFIVGTGDISDLSRMLRIEPARIGDRV